MNILVVGGSSGLGLALGQQLAKKGNKVVVTGRKDPKDKTVEFRNFDLTRPNLAKEIDKFLETLPKIESLYYVAGFYQGGRVTDLSTKQIEDMLSVGGRGLILFVRALLAKQGGLKELVTITSTSQWTPRKLEPIYNFVKAGAGQFSSGLAEDGRIAKVLVAGPAGMRTAFWNGVQRDDLDSMLDKAWVAEQILLASKSKFRFKFIKILREPARVEEAEKR